MRRNTWQAPWSDREGVIIGGGLVFLGVVWQVFLPSSGFQLPFWPGNLYLGLIFLALLFTLHFLLKSTSVVKWLSSVPAAVTSAALYCGLAILLGIIPQGQSSGSPIVHVLGLNQLTSSWVFALANLYFLTSLGLATLKRLFPFKLKNVGYLLNHAGLWIALTAAALGSSDLQRLSMNCTEGQPEWRAYDGNGQLVEMPVAIELLDFQIDEYPPKLTLVDNETGRIAVPDKKRAFFSVADSSFQFLDYRVDVDRLLPEAGLIGDRFEPVNEVGSPPAARLTVTRISTGDSQSGWVSSGSFRFQPYAFKISDQYSLVMLPPEPRKYQSDIRVMTQEGQQLTATLEVNKPLKLGGWKLYQLSYKADMGKWSDMSVIELVRDPWIPVVYLGIFMMLAGSLFLFRDGTYKKKGLENGMD
ncbi:MAG: cytochrome c biogenesis protein ResB [Mangrovibacterium sp.]